jgi:hypothetical protein
MLIDGSLIMVVAIFIPPVSLALGIAGAVLVARAATEKRKNPVGSVLLTVAVGAELALLLFQLNTLRAG